MFICLKHVVKHVFLCVLFYLYVLLLYKYKFIDKYIYKLNMKRDNNLIVITNLQTGEKKYFTKDKYMMEWIGCSDKALPTIKSNSSSKFSRFYKYSVEDCSKVKWEDIDNLR